MTTWILEALYKKLYDRWSDSSRNRIRKNIVGWRHYSSAMGISIAEDESYHKTKEAIKEMSDGDELTVKVLREGTLFEISRRIK